MVKVNSRFKIYNFVLNIINIKKCGSAMDEALNPNVKVKGPNLHS
jgi:hypothetical protein